MKVAAFYFKKKKKKKYTVLTNHNFFLMLGVNIQCNIWIGARTKVEMM
jgi:hypothetical protein